MPCWRQLVHLNYRVDARIPWTISIPSNLITQSPRNTHTPTRLTALCPGLPRWAGIRKVKPVWILLEQETVSGSGISWTTCKPAPRSRQTTTPAPHHSKFFTDWMPFLPPNQQRQSTEGKHQETIKSNAYSWLKLVHKRKCVNQLKRLCVCWMRITC